MSLKMRHMVKVNYLFKQCFAVPGLGLILKSKHSFLLLSMGSRAGAMTASPTN